MNDNDMSSQRIIRSKQDSEPQNGYSTMQANAMNAFARPWNPLISIEELGYGIGNFEDHDNWSLYEKYFFGDIADLSTQRVLDFACGAGRNIANWWSTFQHIDGVDISINMLTNAVAYLNYKGVPEDAYDEDIKLYLSNGVNLSIITTDNFYDLITSTIAMQHICVHEIRFMLLQEFYRLLKPGGLIAIQMGYGEDHPNSVPYLDNFYDAESTNRACDVRVEAPSQVEGDLLKIGFRHFEYTIDHAPPGSDNARGGSAIYFRAQK